MNQALHVVEVFISILTNPAKRGRPGGLCLPRTKEMIQFMLDGGTDRETAARFGITKQAANICRQKYNVCGPWLPVPGRRIRQITDGEPPPPPAIHPRVPSGTHAGHTKARRTQFPAMLNSLLAAESSFTAPRSELPATGAMYSLARSKGMKISMQMVSETELRITRVA